jgi:hypothetical protein
MTMRNISLIVRFWIFHNVILILISRIPSNLVIDFVRQTFPVLGFSRNESKRFPHRGFATTSRAPINQGLVMAPLIKSFHASSHGSSNAGRRRRRWVLVIFKGSRGWHVSSDVHEPVRFVDGSARGVGVWGEARALRIKKITKIFRTTCLRAAGSIDAPPAVWVFWRPIWGTESLDRGLIVKFLLSFNLTSS